mgnify:CR=1 FL=1
MMLVTNCSLSKVVNKCLFSIITIPLSLVLICLFFLYFIPSSRTSLNTFVRKMLDYYSSFQVFRVVERHPNNDFTCLGAFFYKKIISAFFASIQLQKMNDHSYHFSDLFTRNYENQLFGIYFYT